MDQNERFRLFRAHSYKAGTGPIQFRGGAWGVHPDFGVCTAPADDIALPIRKEVQRPQNS